MPKITVLPHPQLCPAGITIDAEAGATVCNALLEHHVSIEHACEKACACTTCHVYVRKGYDSLAAATEKEEDLLDKAWGLDPDSRLSCQAVLTDADLVIQIPKYTINMVSERR